jgi:hypothetical protein
LNATADASPEAPTAEAQSSTTNRGDVFRVVAMGIAVSAPPHPLFSLGLDGELAQVLDVLDLGVVGEGILIRLVVKHGYSNRWEEIMRFDQ